ncbi:MAG: Ykud protein [Verrucomicrobiales bacterium]|nr:Ykud protein [Verrucomicrobiales bacterium]
MKSPIKSAGCLFTFAALGALCSCKVVPVPPVPAVPARPAAPVLYEWQGAELPGPVAMSIDLSEQKGTITRGGEPAGWTYVATGVPGRGTPTGSFSITEKVRDKHSNSWGRIVDADGDTVVRDAKNGRDSVPAGGRFVGAPMPFWMRVNGAIGMHAGPIPHPGSPASHGCIRLPAGMAEILFGVTTVGTRVRIVP